MKKDSASRLLLFALILLGLGVSQIARADDVQMNVPPRTTHVSGLRSLPDPSGHSNSRPEVNGKVVVVIFSVPNMSQGDRQERWSKLLAPKLPGSVTFILVEDMAQAGGVRQMAFDSMKKHFSPHARPFLLLDQDGSVLKKFGIPQDTTQIIIYDKQGNSRDVETKLGEDDEEAATVQRITAIVQKLNK